MGDSPADDRGVVPTQVLLGTFSADRPDTLHALIRAARAEEPRALSDTLERVRVAAASARLGIDDALVVAVPGHLPGPANSLVLAVAEALAVAHGWDHRRDALRRVRPAPEGKTGAARDATEEASTIAWYPVPGRAVIVLVDDVIRTGTTLDACLKAIRAAGDLRPVFAMAIAARRI